MSDSWRPGAIARAAGRGLHEAMLADAALILAEAAKNAPLGDDEHAGELRASGHIEEERHAILVVFSIDAEERRAKPSEQHEHFDYSHPRGGGPKYLENAVKSMGDRLAVAVAHQVKTHVERVRT